MFASGGAALGTSLVLSAFAIHAENRAEDFLGKQSRGNVTKAQLSAYEDAIEDRNRLRAATVATLASAAGLFITGWFLHELDQPSPQQSSRVAARPSERHALGRADSRTLQRKPRTPSLSLAPLASTAGFFAGIRGEF